MDSIFVFDQKVVQLLQNVYRLGQVAMKITFARYDVESEFQTYMPYEMTLGYRLMRLYDVKSGLLNQINSVLGSAQFYIIIDRDCKLKFPVTPSQIPSTRQLTKSNQAGTISEPTLIQMITTAYEAGSIYIRMERLKGSSQVKINMENSRTFVTIAALSTCTRGITTDFGNSLTELTDLLQSVSINNVWCHFKSGDLFIVEDLD
jgi:hypothetical protein